MCKVTVIDAMMGKGKSSWARQQMNEHPEGPYLYVTPFLTEIERTIDLCPKANMVQPRNLCGKTKLEDLNDLLATGRNIATTHVTFSNANDETVSLIHQGGYTLILDEVAEVLVDYNDAAKDNLTTGDINRLKNEGDIETDDLFRVHWIKNASYGENKYSKIEQIARNGNLYLIEGKLLIWVFPPEVFTAFKDVYIMTYMFDGSEMQPYLRYYNIDYELKGVERLPDGRWRLCEYRNDVATRGQFRELIEVYEDAEMNDYKNSALSAGYYKRMEKDDWERLRKQLYTLFHNRWKAKTEDILWTCIGDEAYKKLKGGGFSRKELRKSEIEEYEDLPTAERNRQLAELRGQRVSYIACNARGYNEYGHKHYLAYLCNMFPNPMKQRFFERKSGADGEQIRLDEDRWALCAMLQWIWRSAIRNGEKVHIWIPSKRMRKLLEGWFKGEY